MEVKVSAKREWKNLVGLMRYECTEYTENTEHTELIEYAEDKGVRLVWVSLQIKQKCLVLLSKWKLVFPFVDVQCWLNSERWGKSNGLVRRGSVRLYQGLSHLGLI